MDADYKSHFTKLRTRHPKASYPEFECSTLVVYLDGSISARQCATKLTRHTDRRIPVSGKLCIWRLIIELARDHAETDDDLIELIKEIRGIPSSKETGGIDWTNETQSFAEAWRAAYDSVWSQMRDAVHRQEVSATSELSRQWTNINRFSAALHHADLADDMANGLRLIVETLEKRNVSLSQLQLNLGAAAAWLELASKELKANAALVTQHTNWAADGEANNSGDVDGKRLAVWRDTLVRLSNTEGLTDATVRACENACIAIEQALWEKKK